MSLQKITIFSLAVLLSSIAVVFSPLTAAEFKNPFAQWEQLKTETDAAETAPKKQQATLPTTVSKQEVEYFSPNAKPVSQPTEPKPAVKKERLAVRKSSEKPSEKTVTAAESVSTDAEASRGVKTAQFSDDGSAGKVTVKQTAGEYDGNANPFAEFLGGTETSTTEDLVIPAAPEVAEPQIDFGLAPKVTAEAPESNVPAATAPAPTGPQTPTVSLRWEHDGEFNIGQQAKCRLLVHNTGRSTVRNVVVEAALPAGLQVLGSRPLPDTTGENAIWNFSELAPNDRKEIELDILPQLEGDLAINALVRITGQTSSTFAVRQPRVAVDIEGPDRVEIGQVAHYTVTVSNPGSGAARNVVIQAAVPEGLENRHGRRLSIEIGTLNAGEVRQARLTLTGVDGGDQNLAVRVLGDGDLSDEVNAIVSVAEPKLNIGLRGPAATSVGKAADYEIVVINEGDLESNNVRAKFRLPKGYEFVSAGAGGKLTEEEGTVDWFVGTLKSGDMKHFTVTLIPQATGAEKLQAGVISEHGGVKIAEHATSVNGSADLKLTVASSSPNIAPGDEAVFEVRITNAGTVAADNVGLSCELPTGLKLVDIAGPSKYIEDSGAVIFRAMPVLDAGETATFALKTRCVRTGRHRVRVRVASESITEALIDEASTTGVSQ